MPWKFEGLSGENAHRRLLPASPLTRLINDCRQQCERSNEVIAGQSLDQIGRHPDFQSPQASLRWMLIHMIEETARHVGPLDILREQLDGTTCYY